MTLVPFTSALLAAVQPWFENPEVRHRLGGPEWPARELRLMVERPGDEFRGRRVLRTHSWVALDGTGLPVAKIGGQGRPWHPDVADVRVFALGIDSDSVASARCALSSVFSSDHLEPDWEDTVYFLLRRHHIRGGSVPLV